MHKNHRRKNRYRNQKGRWWGRLTTYRQVYWTKERARQRHLMAHERYDDLQDRHPDTVLWDAT